MDFFFKPKGVALIGATPNKRKGGNVILKNLTKGFKGKIYPVNPRYDDIEGLKCYPAIGDTPDPIDLAIIYVAATMVSDVIKNCVNRGISGVIIQSAGFAEAGDEGKELQNDLNKIAKETGIRIWGPNCMGLVDAVNKNVFSFVTHAIWEQGLIPGDVSIIVQSGMLSAGFLIDIISHGTMGISKACSIGNKVDVDECDVLEYLIKDNDTKAVGLYLESIPNGKRFVEICRNSKKPIVVLKGGKSEGGAKAALSHTASFAGDGAVITGALAQAGVVEAHDFMQMMDLSRALSMYPSLPSESKNRVVVMSPSGGAGIVASDFIENLGMTLSDLSESTRKSFQTVYPEWMPASNPVDLFPAVERHGSKKVFHTVFEAICKDPNVDAILFHCFVGAFGKVPDFSSLAEIAKKGKKPVFCWVMGMQKEAREFHMHVQNLGIPVYRELYRTVESMAAVFEYNSYKKSIAYENASSSSHGIKFPENFHENLKEYQGILDEYESKKILSACDIPVVTERIVMSKDEALNTASEFGFPVVMKGILKKEVHKTELGLVRLGISSPDMVASTYNELAKAISDNGQVLIQPQIQGDIELITGLIRDPQFGPCVMIGFGGVMAEVLDDTTFAIAPLNVAQAHDMINRLKTQKLLNGFRGSPPLDRESLARLLVCISELGEGCPTISEIDINPLIIAEGKPVAVDATIILDDI